MTRSITATLPRNHDRDESICSSIQWPPNFTNVSDDFFKVHAATMCAHWCQLDTNVPRPLPACVLPLLEDELRKLKTLISSSSEITDLVKTNAARRRLFWPMFFGRYPNQFRTIGYFWMLQQQLGRSGVAIEQFISKLHYIVGDPLRQHSSDEWLEYSTMVNANGPMVKDFDSSEVFNVWLKMNHEMVKVGRSYSTA